jgi:hypothetical protein
MISFLDPITRGKSPFTYVVEVFNLSWEPWHLRCSHYGNFSLHSLQLIYSLIDMLIINLSVKISEKVDCALMIDHFRWP